jgi:hypothetical protein
MVPVSGYSVGLGLFFGQTARAQDLFCKSLERYGAVERAQTEQTISENELYPEAKRFLDGRIIPMRHFLSFRRSSIPTVNNSSASNIFVQLSPLVLKQRSIR